MLDMICCPGSGVRARAKLPRYHDDYGRSGQQGNDHAVIELNPELTDQVVACWVVGGSYPRLAGPRKGGLEKVLSGTRERVIM